MNNATDDLPKEATRVELKRLYSILTKLGTEELKTYGDKFPSMVTIILPGRILIPLPMGPEEHNRWTLVNIIKNERVLALIVIAKGWSVRSNGGEFESFSLNYYPGSYEVFFAGLESVEVMKTKIWSIKRDQKGKIIFPLGRPEVFVDDEAFALRFTRNYHPWGGNGHGIYYA